jgi:RimJ/RimL family protein N-acetyltransferase
MSDQVSLRATTPEDPAIFFRFQQDPEAVRMAAFTAKDPTDEGAHMAHWARILADPTITNRTILLDGEVAGNIFCFLMDGEPQVGYWIDRRFWGRNVATRALTQFLEIITMRPLYASAAADNAGSIRVLQKCGFRYVETITGFANARNAEIEEALFRLD